ncbi:MAG: hypothetical protein NT027_02315, partial [Proteobacteria bacterium]|nr:hypothetical protein [Pseudomonadota bacterium]
MKSKRILKLIICLLALLAVGSFLAVKFEKVARSDPDRYYHYAVSKITAETFAPKELPQIFGLGWDSFFVEKEFLFHLYTGFAYGLAQEKGVVLACLLLGIGVLISVFLVCIRPNQSHREWTALILTLSICLSSGRFANRMFTVRPHVLATLIVILLLGALLSRRRYLTFLLSFLFALAYHAFYIPVMLSILGVVVAVFVEKSKSGTLPRAALNCLYATLGGIVVGGILNPYFPSNFVIGYQVLMIALISTGLSISEFGNELLPLNGTQLIMQYGGYYALLFGGVAFYGYRIIAYRMEKKSDLESCDQSKAEFFESLLSFAAFSMFSLISVHSPRGIEFMVPFAAIALSRSFHFGGRIPWKILAIACALFIVQFPKNKVLAWSEVIWDDFLKPENERVKSLEAFAKIPHSTEKIRVVNCNWDLSPYLFYARPDLRFVDILDPSLLYARNSELYSMRKSMLSAEAPDAWGLLREGFD